MLRSILIVAVALGLGCYPTPHYSPPADTGQQCNTNSNTCSSTLCVEGRCTSHCGIDEECLPGWTCNAPKKTESHCTCVASPEICDGKDNDCNGVIDDQPEVDQECRQQGSGVVCQAGACACDETNQCGGCVSLAIDPQHCGTCDRVCSAEGSAAPFCAASACATIESIAPNNGAGPVMFAVDATHLFMGDQGIGRIDQWSLVDGSHFAIGGTGGIVLSMTADAHSVYWGVAKNGSIFRADIDGKDETQLAANQSPSFGIAVDETDVYWTTEPPVDLLGIGPGQVLKVPKSGGEITVVAERQNGAWGIAVDATNVYWTNFVSGTVMKKAKAGGEPVVLAEGQAGPTTIIVDGASLYWTNAGTINGTHASDFLPGLSEPSVAPFTGSVVKMSIEGGAPVVLASAQNVPLWGLAVNATHVYWTNSAMPLTGTKLGTVMRVPINGGTPSTLVIEQLHPWGLALANGGIYWSTGALLPGKDSLSHGQVQKLVLRDAE